MPNKNKGGRQTRKEKTGAHKDPTFMTPYQQARFEAKKCTKRAKRAQRRNHA